MIKLIYFTKIYQKFNYEKNIIKTFFLPMFLNVFVSLQIGEKLIYYISTSSKITVVETISEYIWGNLSYSTKLNFILQEPKELKRNQCKLSAFSNGEIA